MYQQNQGQSDGATDFAIIIVILFVAFMLIVEYKPEWFIGPWRFAKIGEAYLLSLIPWDRSAEFLKIFDFLTRISSKEIDFAMVQAINAEFKWYFNAVWCGLIGIMAWKVLNGGYPRKVFSMETLLVNQRDVWPSAFLMTEHKPSDEKDIEDGDWAMAMGPIEYMQAYEILDPNEEFVGGENGSKINKSLCEEVLKDQLGDKWEGSKNLDINERRVFAILAARVAGKPKVSREIVVDMSTAYATGKFDAVDKKVNAAISKFEKNELVQKVMSSHAYTRTGLASLLQQSRSDGVMASADLLWLKIEDRELWYTINCVGRRVCFTECAGIWAHWKAENAVGRALSEPMVSEAVKSLEEYVIYGF